MSSSRLRKIWPHVAAVALVAVFWGLCCASLWDKSPMFDEPTHIAGGYSYFTTGEFRLHTENGSLPQRLAALPLIMDGLEADVREAPGWPVSHVYDVSRHLLYRSGNDQTHILRLSRAGMTTVAALLGACVYVIAFRRYGPLGGLLSLAAFAFSPTFLAYGGLAVSDLTASLMFLLASVLVWRSLRRASWASVLAGGLACGGLLLSKSSGPLIVGVIGVMLVARLLSREGLTLAAGLWTRTLSPRPGRLAGMAAVLTAQALLAATVVWAAYGFRHAAIPDPGPHDRLIESWQSLAEKNAAARTLKLASEYRLLPEAYLHGVAYTLAHADSRMSFMAGHYSGTGWRTYFPFCFAVKNPLSWLLLLTVALAAAIVVWRGRSDKRQVTSDKSRNVLSSTTIASRENNEANQTSPSLVASRWSLVTSSIHETAPLWSLVLIYGLAACASNINIGHRHILPVYAPLVILIGAAATLPRRWRLLPIALTVLLAAETLYDFPNYVPYMNQFVGGPDRGWRVLGDSSQDWGGELPALKRWIDDRRARRPDERMYFAYFGSGLPAYYRIDATQLPSFFDLRTPGQKDWGPLKPGTYCLSASQVTFCRPHPMGPWNDQYETTYQQLRAQARPFEETANDPAARAALIRQSPNQWMKTLQSLPDHEHYRFARLCAYLRTNCEPVEKINHAILVFEVTQEHLDQALTGPPPELRSRVTARE